MRAALLGVIGVICGAALAVFLVLNNENAISTQSIDQDLAEIVKHIDEADAEAARYGGGLILSFIELRRAVYEETKAILLQKRMTYIHRVNLDWKVSGSEQPTSGADLKAIEHEIEGVRGEVEAAELEAARYSGGLILSLIQLRKAQHEITLAGLEQARLARLYGLHLPGFTQTKPTLPVPVDLDDPKAKDAL